MDVLVILGSKSDLEKAKPCIDTLKQFSIDYKLAIASAHRTPDYVNELIKNSEQDGTKVIIAMAGMAAHLPGVIASKTILPVIGVPLSAGALAGKDALYAIVQMPSGYPVATVGVDVSKNSALLAIQILAINNSDLSTALVRNRNEMKDNVIAANKLLDTLKN